MLIAMLQGMSVIFLINQSLICILHTPLRHSSCGFAQRATICVVLRSLKPISLYAHMMIVNSSIRSIKYLICLSVIMKLMETIWAKPQATSTTASNP